MSAYSSSATWLVNSYFVYSLNLYGLLFGAHGFKKQVGDHSRLEKTGIPMKRIVVKPRAKKTDIVNDACRTFTFFNMDSYIFNDVEEKENEPSHSDESGYLSESELVVDDSD